MRRSRVHDSTAEAVAGNALGDAVLTSVLSRVEDELERTVFLAHVALELPVAAVARAFALDPKAVEDTVSSVLRKLRSDEALKAQLAGIRRAGQAEHYLVIAEKLNLQDWLCARCGRPMVQPKVGRPRKTCSDSCRVALSLANGRGWKDSDDWITGLPRAEGGITSPDEQLRYRAYPALTAQEADAMRRMLRRVLHGTSGPYRTTDCTARNRALVLLGFACPVQLSASDLAALALEDVHFTAKGLEVRLNWRTGKSVSRQYVTVPPDRAPDLCPVRAMRTWKGRLSKVSSPDHPLFPRMSTWDYVTSRRSGAEGRPRPSMGGRVAASEIVKAIQEAQLRPRKLSESTLLPAFFRETASVEINMRILSRTW